MNHEEQATKISNIISRSWSDESFKQSFVTNPASTLRSEGLSIPEGIEICVFENSANVAHLVIPAALAKGDITDAQLEGVAGGFPLVMMASLVVFTLLGGVIIGGVGIGAGFGFDRARKKR